MSIAAATPVKVTDQLLLNDKPKNKEMEHKQNKKPSDLEKHLD